MSKQLGKLLFPELSISERDAISWEAADVIYNTDTNIIQYYNGTEWVNLYSEGQSIDPVDVGGGAASMVMSFASGGISYIEGGQNTYQKLASFIFGGTDEIGVITNININSWVSNNGSVDVRLVCCGDGSVIAEKLGINSQLETNVVNMGTITNLPTGADIIEIQAKKVTGGGASKARIGSLELQY